MRVLHRFTLTVTVLFALSLHSIAGTSTACQDADLIVHSGHLVTMDPAHPVVSAMAIRDGRILAVGSKQAIVDCASARTRIVDLQKRTVLPGLIDVHTHGMEWTKGILRGQIDAGYPTVHAISEVTKEVGRRAAALKTGEWIVGSSGMTPSSRSIATSPARILILFRRTIRSFWFT